MLRLVYVTNKYSLPSKMENFHNLEVFPFQVLADRGTVYPEYLLKIPTGCGGFIQSGHDNCWCVDVRYCKSAYKKGQRWQYKDEFVIEFIEDDKRNCRIVSSKSIYRSVGSFFQDPAIETNQDWCYLEGQDKPEDISEVK